jgi:hypothetical protein
MPIVVRVVDGPIPTDVQGREMTSGVGWFQASAIDQRFYDPVLVNAAKPACEPSPSPKQRLVAHALGVLERNRELFVRLA